MTLFECFKKHECDKGWRHRYDRFYEPIFEPIRHQPIRLLEIGIYRGASIAAWLDYFPNAEIIGVDTFQRIPADEIAVLKNPRVSFYACDSTVFAPKIDPVDFVIDDGSHDPRKQMATAYLYRPLVKRSGMYVIEDIRDVSSIANIYAGVIHRGAAGESIAVL